MTAFSATAEYGTAEAPVAGISFACNGASFVVSAKTIAGQARHTAAPASFSLAGAAILLASALTAAVAPFALSGKAIALPVSAPMSPAAIVWSGKAAGMSMPVATAAWQWAGKPVVLAPSIACGKGAYLLGAGAAQAAMPVGAATFAMSGQASAGVAAAALSPLALTFYGYPVFRTINVGLGVPGEPATAEYGTAEFPRSVTFGVAAEAGSFALTGHATAFQTAGVVAPAAFNLIGQAAELAMPVPAVSWAVTGQSLSFVTTNALANAVFSVSGQAAQMAMAVNAAQFSWSGQALLLRIAENVDRGVFAWSGQAIGLLPLDGTSFVWTGRDALLRASLERASFAMTGQDAFAVKWLGVSPAAFLWTGQVSTGLISQALSRASFNLLSWSIADIIGPKGAHTYLVEVQAHDGAQLRTFYLSTAGFTSQPSDTPANRYYEPRIIDPGNFERALFDGTALRGRARSGSGDVVIASGDPGNGLVLDDWFTHGWSQRDIRVKSLPQGARSLSAVSTLFVGKLGGISSTKPLDQLTLKIADRLGDLEQPLLTELFAGTTLSTGPTAEGNADLNGKIKQQCWGACANVPLQAANPYDLIYLVSRVAAAAITVYDGGDPLTYDGDSASISALRAAAIAGGHYRTCLSAGLVRVGALPQKALTADVVEGATSAARTAAQIAYRMLIAYGVPSNAISTGSLAVLDTLNAAECCYFVDDDRNVISAVQDVLDSIGAWMVPDRDGTLVFGRFDAPSTAPQSTFDLDTVAIGDSFDMVDSDLPAWRIIVEYGPVFTVQGDNDLLGAVGAERRATLAKQFRTTTAEATSVRAKHLSAREVTVRTYLVDPVAAGAEAARQLALLSAERQRYNITMPLTDAWPSVPGNAITLRHKRLGLSGGKPFTVLQRVDQYQNDTVQFALWG